LNGSRFGAAAAHDRQREHGAVSNQQVIPDQGQHGIGFALVEHAQQRQGDMQRAPGECFPLHGDGTFRDKKIGIDASDDPFRRPVSHRPTNISRS